MSLFTITTLCFAVFIAAPSITEAQKDYCDASLCSSWEGKHIACGHNHQFDKTCPKDASLLKITPQLKQSILQLHNEKRNLVAGGNAPKYSPACRMGTMEWDDELANFAELNVRQCKMRHDYCHNTKAYPLAGQNLAFQSYYGTPNFDNLIVDAIQGWYDELTDCDMNIIKKFPEAYSGPVITHFTGMMMEGNTRIGCAAATYSVPGEEYKIYLMACNLAYRTMQTQAVYQTCSAPASKCLTGKNSRYPNLCSSAEKYDISN